jgi:hypothetical protein
MKPSSRYFVGMLLAVAFLVGPGLVIPGYFNRVPVGLHIVLVWLVVLLVTIVSRCPGCGLPIFLRYNKGASALGRYLFVSVPPKQCSRCGTSL